MFPTIQRTEEEGAEGDTRMLLHKSAPETVQNVFGNYVFIYLGLRASLQSKGSKY